MVWLSSASPKNNLNQKHREPGRPHDHAVFGGRFRAQGWGSLHRSAPCLHKERGASQSWGPRPLPRDAGSGFIGVPLGIRIWKN